MWQNTYVASVVNMAESSDVIQHRSYVNDLPATLFTAAHHAQCGRM